MVQYPS